jgi:hypothetical protein
MIKTIALLALLWTLSAAGATSLALLTIKPDAANRTATTHLLKLQDELALP